MLKWDYVDMHIYRARVPGGWFVKIENQRVEEVTYIKDPYHEWLLND